MHVEMVDGHSDLSPKSEVRIWNEGVWFRNCHLNGDNSYSEKIDMQLPGTRVEKAGGGTPGCGEEAPAESCSQDLLYPNFLPSSVPSRLALPECLNSSLCRCAAALTFSERFLKGHIGESALAFNDQLYFPQKSFDLAGLSSTV